MNSSQHSMGNSLALAEGRGEARTAVSQLASELRARWDEGAPPDAQAALALHPELGADRSVVRDLAYEEYCRRREAGEALDPDAFCDRFPALKASLRRLLEAHEFCEENPDLWSEESQRWPGPGELVGGFELRRELGRGAFARVYLAAEPLLGGRAVAVKLSRWGTAEAELLGKLSHPNVVPVHSISADPTRGLTAICMPYLGAATLCDVLDRAFAGPAGPAGARVILEAAREAIPAGELAGEPPPPAPLLRSGTYVDGVRHLAAQLADALAFVHARGICHHDLKPSNVLLTPDGRPMLLDFNLSRDATRAAGVPGGTLPYMSPEQLRATGPGDPEGAAPPGPAADIFSFGVLLYELLSGAHPFGPIPAGAVNSTEREGLRQRLLTRLGSRPRPLREVSPAVDESLAQLVEGCLAYRPEDRPRAADLARALRGSLSRLRRAGRWVRRRPLLAAALLTVALAAAAAGGYLLVTREPEDVRQFKLARAAYARQDPGRAVEHFTRAIYLEPTRAAAFFGRARARQRLGGQQDFESAWSDYEQADKLAPQGKAKAGVGFCLNRQGRAELAVRWYKDAIAAGYERAEVLNNLGFTYLQLNQPQEARKSLDRAVKLNPRLQAAYHNRAWSHYDDGVRLWGLIYGRQPGQGPDPQGAQRLRELDDHTRAGIEDIERALQLGPASAELSLDAAGLYALKAWRDREAVGVALRHLQRLAREDLEQTANDLVFTRVCADPEFARLRQAALPRAGNLPTTSRLLDPIRDEEN
jgi:eukaryotic-like serine/threonine-protein kinase